MLSLSRQIGLVESIGSELSRVSTETSHGAMMRKLSLNLIVIGLTLLTGQARANIITFVEDNQEGLTITQTIMPAVCGPGQPPFRETVICSGLLDGVGIGVQPRPTLSGRVAFVEPGTQTLSDLVSLTFTEGVIVTSYSISFSSDPFNPVPDLGDLVPLDETTSVLDISQDFGVLLPAGLTVKVQNDLDPGPETPEPSMFALGSITILTLCTKRYLKRLGWISGGRA